jgi:hypothetical protein
MRACWTKQTKKNITFNNFNLCYIHQTLAHCSLKYYNNDKNNRPRITYFVLTRFCVFSKKNTYLLELIITNSDAQNKSCLTFFSLKVKGSKTW